MTDGADASADEIASPVSGSKKCRRSVSTPRTARPRARIGRARIDPGHTLRPPMRRRSRPGSSPAGARLLPQLRFLAHPAGVHGEVDQLLAAEHLDVVRRPRSGSGPGFRRRTRGETPGRSGARGGCPRPRPRPRYAASGGFRFRTAAGSDSRCEPRTTAASADAPAPRSSEPRTGSSPGDPMNSATNRLAGSLVQLLRRAVLLQHAVRIPRRGRPSSSPRPGRA